LLDLPQVYARAPIGVAFTLFEKANDAVFLENEDDDIIAVNQRATDLLGYTRAELLGMKVPDLQAPEVRGCLGTVIKGELQSHQDCPFEGLDLHRDGRRIPVEITNAVILEDGERLVLSVVRDITERKRAEEATRARLRFEQLLAELSVRFVNLPSAAVDQAVEDRLRHLVEYLILTRNEAEHHLREALQKIKQLQDQQQAENADMRGRLQLDPIHPMIVGRSDALAQALAQVKQVAATDATVLLLGETGTGKELLAGAIHDLSARRGRPMIKVNCAAMPVTLIESELFGREKGAFTGALSRQVGRFDLADSSTIFLDEVGELPLETQGKLLRVMQDGCFERLGSPKTIRVQVRVIAASNRDLAQMVADGRFRKDLYYRLNVFPIQIPPLRERSEDIPLLVWSFVEELGKRMGKSIEAVSQRSLDALQHHPWPGNIRELRNAVERALITCQGPTLFIEPPALSEPMETVMTLDEVERAHILRVLQMTGWRVRGKNGAATILGLPPTTLESRMAKLLVHRPCHPSEIP
jgi:PAS domain S-box-containing protein